jgi:iron complex transport system ATP-binding protein
MNLLVKEGYEVTAGVLNVLDTDHETAQSLDVTVVDEAPFSPITEESHAANLRLIENSDLVIMTSLPFGPGNMLNLKAAKFALEGGIPLFIFKATAANHEFTFEEADDLLRDIKQAGVKEISSSKELIKIIELKK